MYGTRDLHGEMHCYQWVVKAGPHMHVRRFPYLAMQRSVIGCNHFITVMEIGFDSSSL